MTLIENIRTFMSTCPYLPEANKNINVNYLSQDISSYSIEELEEKTLIKKYVDGSSIKQLVFILTSRESYSDDVLKNVEASGFYEHFSEWLEGQSLKNILPILSEGKKSKKIETLSNGYVFEVKEDKCQHKIKCRLVYFQEGGK